MPLNPWPVAPYRPLRGGVGGCMGNWGMPMFTGGCHLGEVAGEPGMGYIMLRLRAWAKSRLVMVAWGYNEPGEPGCGIRYTDAGSVP